MSVHTERKEPFLRLAKRDDIAPAKAWAIRAAAILLALAAGGLIILILGHNPIAVYGSMVEGSLGKPRALRETVKKAVPLLGAALAIAPAFKMKFWNIGAEGQILGGRHCLQLFRPVLGREPAPAGAAGGHGGSGYSAGALWGDSRGIQGPLGPMRPCSL